MSEVFGVTLPGTANDYGTDEKDFTITVKEPPITYLTTRWEISGSQLVIEYKASSGTEKTAKFQP